MAVDRGSGGVVEDSRTGPGESRGGPVGSSGSPEAGREEPESRYFDSHLHLTDGRFVGEVEAVLRRARAAGVAELVTVATDPEDAREAAALARASRGLWATAGLHPHAADRY
ncbi:MAG: TatD family hydrolase, partial [Gemmatimonadota bacterium]|nr:TatD family hydrolase [Gemmatimonadota bacterium]